jgi:tRNA threonylcarbamoyladenosine biosynthesis protein TsaB
MIKLLLIETANRHCSVALSEDKNLVGLKESDEVNAHSRVITIYIDELLESRKLKPSEIDAVAVSMGPGSYTGLRIGVSAAKGLCYALNKPLLAISTLQSMAIGSIEKLKSERNFTEKLLFCPMIDARRMEVYDALFDSSGNFVREVKAEVIDEQSFAEELKNHQIIFSGDGAEKCKRIISHPNAIFQEPAYPSAKNMIGLAYDKFINQQFEDTAYFEPFYLKSFVAGLPKVKGLK